MNLPYPYDARTTAPGVRVLPVPRRRVDGLTYSQSKAARRTHVVDRQGNVRTLTEMEKGGALPLGINSINHSVEPWIKGTRPVYQHRTPGKKMSTGTDCKGPVNTVFQGKIESSIQVKDRLGGPHTRHPLSAALKGRKFPPQEFVP